MNQIEIAFKNLGLKSNSTVMIHADSIILSQLEKNVKNKFKYLQDKIIKFFKNRGTLIIPSFNQKSFIEKKIFDVNKTPASIGLFYEKFRKNKFMKRSFHPFFSVCVFGKNKKKYLNAKLTDCFGNGTLFDLLYKDRATIVNMGCKFQATFVHYVEQQENVGYRYFKNFSGKIINLTKKKNITVKYFVRNRKIDPQYDFEELEKILKKKRQIHYTSFGRFLISAVNTKNLYNVIKKNIKINKMLLLEK